MNKKVKITVLKYFGKKDLQKILKRIVKDNLMDHESIVSSYFRSDL